MNKRTVVEFDDFIKFYMERVDGEDEWDEGEVWYEIFENDDNEESDHTIVVKGPNAKQLAYTCLTALNKRKS